MNHTVVWPLTCKGQLDFRPWANKPDFLRPELVLLSAQTSRAVILMLDIFTLSDKFQSDRDKGNKRASAEVVWTYSDHPQGMQIYDGHSWQQHCSQGANTLSSVVYILDGGYPASLNIVAPSWLQSVCINNWGSSDASAEALQLDFSWVTHGLEGVLGTHIRSKQMSGL